MGIYRNENVNSLPEQVQENKEAIKQINEILENIDPEQVATILSDIQALKAEQVVQNTAIGANQTAIGNNTNLINNEKTAREGLIDLDASGNTRVKSVTGKTAGVASDTASFVDSADSGIAVSNTGITLTTDKEDDAHQVRFDNSGNFQVSNGHVLEFDNTGAITIDGQPIGGGGGGQLYMHNITITSTTNVWSINIMFISSFSTSFGNNFQGLAEYIRDNGLTLMACGYYKALNVILQRVFYAGGALKAYGYSQNSQSFDAYSIETFGGYNISDNVFTL